MTDATPNSIGAEGKARPGRLRLILLVLLSVLSLGGGLVAASGAQVLFGVNDLRTARDMAAAGLGHMVDLTHVSQCYRLSRDAFLDRLPDRLGLLATHHLARQARRGIGGGGGRVGKGGRARWT